MDCLAFHTVTATIEATASFKHFKLALCKTSSEQTLSDSFVLVMVCAVAFMALLISSVTPALHLSSLLSLTGIVTGQAAKILRVREPQMAI